MSLSWTFLSQTLEPTARWLCQDFLPLAVEAARLAVPHWSFKMNILIVEDHQAYAEAVARMLKRKLGDTCTVYIAATLTDGLRLAKAAVMDVTLVDLCLP